MAKQAVPRIGDAYRIPLEGERFVVAHVVAKYLSSEYIAVYAGTCATGSEEARCVEASLENDVVLLALTYDAKIVRGDRPHVGLYDVPLDRIPFPAYVVARDAATGRSEVEDYTGTRRRDATTEEAAVLPNRTTVGPIALEQAARALHGHTGWLERFDTFKPFPTDWLSASIFGPPLLGE
jgi:hypothetical protein